VQEPTGLEQMACFTLYSASRAITGLYRPALDELGLTYPQYVTMIVIWQRGTVTVSDLGTALDLDSGTLSPLLKRLEAQGLIHRERGTHDERTVWITSTTKGHDLRARAQDIPARLACAINLTHHEFDQLLHLMSRVRDAAATSTL
jgi:MarR family transcriptional regulator, organic hydroperoxide resistance regulator